MKYIITVALPFHVEEADIDIVDTGDVLLKQQATDIDNDNKKDQYPPSFVTFDCTEPLCVMQFRREDRLRAHLLVGTHKIMSPSFQLLDKAAVIYKECMESDALKEIPILTSTDTTVRNRRILTSHLKEGWALFHPRAKVTFTPAQRLFLSEKYDEGEISGAKWDPSKLAEVCSL